MIDPPLAELCRRIAALLASERRCIIGLAGPPGSGKSTLVRELAANFANESVIVPMDGFHLANSELARIGRSHRKGAPDTFDGSGYVALLERLRGQRPGDTLYAPDFRREIEEAVAGAIAVTPEKRLILTEGNYLLLDRDPWLAVRAIVDEIWFVAVDPEVRLQRLIARHMHYGRDERAARAWVDESDEPNAVLIEASRSRADLVVTLS